MNLIAALIMLVLAVAVYSTSVIAAVVFTVVGLALLFGVFDAGHR